MTDDAPHGGGRRVRAAIVERIIDRAPGTRSLFLMPTGGRALSFVPGQFISIAIPLGDETRTRAYSIASRAEDAAPFEICFDRVSGGRGSGWLFERAIGDTIDFTGPFGTFTMDRAPDAETVFIAEGTAIAPIRPMLHRAAAAPAHPAMTLLHAATSPEHLLYRAEIAELAAHSTGIVIETVIAPAPEIYNRLLAEAERRWVRADSDRSRQFYISGVGKGVSALRDLMRGAGYERRAVRYEQW